MAKGEETQVDGGVVIRVDQAELARRSKDRAAFHRNHLVKTTWSRSTSGPAGAVKEKFKEHRLFELKGKNGKVLRRAKKTRICCMLKDRHLLGGRLPTKEMCEYLNLKYPYGRPALPRGD